MENEIVEIKSFFGKNNLKFSNDWLESCVLWCKEEKLPANYTQKQLQSLVYEQWLFLDLRDVELPILPLNLNKEIHKVLHGNYYLQIMETIDISRPKLWQLNKIQNSHILTRGLQEDSEIAGSGKRMLLLKLTDGLQEVFAMEYKPNPELSINITPGTKVMLTGPLQIRRGRIMLERNNIKLLGGEVEELLVPNAAENVLARSLGLPLNPNPSTINEEKNEINNSDKFPDNRTNQLPPKPQVRNPQQELPNRIEVELNAFRHSEMDVAMPSAPPSPNQTPNLFGNHDVNFDPMDVADFDNPFDSKSTNKKQDLSVNEINQSLSDDDDIFNNIDIDAHLDLVEKQANLPSSTRKPKQVTLEDILKNKSETTKGVFKVKVRFKSVVEKLSFRDGEYKIIIKVEDDTCEIITKVHSDVITDFAQHSPTALISFKSRILENDDWAKKTVMQALENIKKKLLSINGVVEMHVSKNEEYPIITQVL